MKRVITAIRRRIWPGPSTARRRGMVVAGIILGVLGVLGWAGYGVGSYGISLASEYPRQEAEAFLRDLAGGNPKAAVARCDATMPAETVSALANRIIRFGPFKTLSLPSRKVSTAGGVMQWELTGTATFDKASRGVTFVVLRRPDGSYRIDDVAMRD